MGWKELVAEKRSRRDAGIPKDWLLPEVPPDDVLDVTAIPDTCGILTELEKEITNSPFQDLTRRLADKTWTSVEVVTAFYKRAIIAHQLTNCLTEIFVEKALERARELDKYIQETGTVMGPLHGIPVSLKDQINIEGVESTMGYVSWIGVYPERNSELVEILLSLGAVPFVKTNVPQTLMWPETFNHVFGGEGALIALKGSPLGVGSDIGGSVRIPSAMCGLYGLRPSYGRVPYAGCVNSMEGQDSVRSVLGPMANSIDVIEVFLRGVADQKPWNKDPLSVRKPWNEKEFQLLEHGEGNGLCFGIMWNDGVTTPHPPIKRGLEIAKKALLAAGHKVINWKPLKHNEILECLRDVWSAGSADDYASVVSLTGEPLVSTMVPGLELDEPASFFGPKATEKGISAYRLWQVQKKKQTLREEYLRYWESTVKQTGTGRPVDAILSPAAAFVAPPHGKYKYADYTMVWNALDYSALVIPVTKVDEQLDIKERIDFLSERDEEVAQLYEPSLFKNAPVAIQVVGRTLEEEAVIAIGRIIDSAITALRH